MLRVSLEAACEPASMLSLGQGTWNSVCVKSNCRVNMLQYMCVLTLLPLKLIFLSPVEPLSMVMGLHACTHTHTLLRPLLRHVSFTRDGTSLLWRGLHCAHGV